MVIPAPAIQPAPQIRKKKSVSIPFSEVARNNLRFEAASYNIEGRALFSILQSCPYTLIPLLNADRGLCKSAHNAFRFKRVFVDEEHGVPFLTSSNIIELNPKPDCFLSKKQTRNLQKLIISPWDVLVSCSGTIGNINITSPSMAGWALSQDAIRITAPDPDTAGYVTAFLRSPYGLSQLQGFTYGSVVQHIEPEHLRSVFIPDLPPILKIFVGHSFVEAALKRDQANSLLDEAEKMLEEALKLPSISQIPRGPLFSKVRFADWQGRLDASFHSIQAQAALSTLRDNNLTLSRLDDPLLTNRIWAVTKFRKRTFIQRGGIPMLSSKQIFQIAPVDVKKLALGAHLDDMDEIGLKENLVLVTRSGTIGKVQIIPKYMNDWAGSEHAHRIEGISNELAGYIFTWLNCPYGQILLEHYQYASVITHIDKDMLSSVQVPILPLQDMENIGRKVLEANTLRNEAWELEQKALEFLNAEIEKDKKESFS